jgi:hypothetical protein
MAFSSCLRVCKIHNGYDSQGYDSFNTTSKTQLKKGREKCITDLIFIKFITGDQLVSTIVLFKVHLSCALNASI